MSVILTAELYQLMSDGVKNIPSRNESIKLRKLTFSSLMRGSKIPFNGFRKVAFDTRRIDQELDYIPRRGLQNYHRSEQFISEATSIRIKAFSKLKSILDSLKEKYERQPEWQDSYARVLLSTLDKGLRTDQKDGDFAESQPGLGSFDYIEELLYVRYRLTVEGIENMSEEELKKIILSKDEELTKKNNSAVEITRKDIGSQSYDSLIDKLFGGVKATKENPQVERTVTITIKDKFVEE